MSGDGDFFLFQSLGVFVSFSQAFHFEEVYTSSRLNLNGDRRTNIRGNSLSPRVCRCLWRSTHFSPTFLKTASKITIMRGLICGPKLAACGLVLSMWGVVIPFIDQALLGIFFTTHSAVLIEDVPLTEDDIHQEIYGLYNSIGYNCFIAAGIYVLVGLFSFCQMNNTRNEYYIVTH
uniref:Ribonuclease, RNase K a n=1 Tax=Takifugu rubripes TaxID=31033 RepID=A0A674NJV8_TAKRU